MLRAKKKLKGGRRSKIPEWLPDWRSLDDYPDPKCAVLRQWAWEFLRRNAEYQAQWRKTIVPWLDENDKFDSDAAMKAQQQVMEKEGLYDGVITNPMVLLQRQFGFSSPFLLPPSTPSSLALKGLYFEQAGIMSYVHPPKEFYPPEKHFEVTAPLKYHEQIFIFDLERPINLQLMLASTSLKQRQKKLLRDREIIVSKYKARNHQQHLLYLRLLDGRAQEASYEDLAQVIFPKNEDGKLKVRDALKAAEKLRDFDYKYIPRSSVK